MKRVLMACALVLAIATVAAAQVPNVVILAAKPITDLLTTIAGYVDGLEALLTTANTGATPVSYSATGFTEDKHAVKTSAGILESVTATNTNASEAYLRCADGSLAGTTPGTPTTLTTPALIIDLAIPGADSGNGLHAAFPKGLAFSTALTCWLVTGAAIGNQTEVVADEVKVLYTLKP